MADRRYRELKDVAGDADALIRSLDKSLHEFREMLGDYSDELEGYIKTKVRDEPDFYHGDITAHLEYENLQLLEEAARVLDMKILKKAGNESFYKVENYLYHFVKIAYAVETLN